MNLGDFENYIEKNYQISLDKILSEVNIDGYTLTGEISHFFDKINSLYEVDDKLNFELYIRFLNNTYNFCDSFSFQEDFIKNEWLEIIKIHLSNYKNESIRELSYFAFQTSTYWGKLSALEFCLFHLDKNEKLIKTQVTELNNIIHERCEDKDDKWKEFTKKYLELLKSNFSDKDEVGMKEIEKALKEYK